MLKTKTRVSHRLKGLIRADLGLAAASITVLAVGLTLTSAGISATGWRSAQPETEADTEFASDVGQTENANESFAADASCATFNARFYFDQPSASFDERFASAFGSEATRKEATVVEHDDDVLLPDDKPVAAPTTPVTISRHASLSEERLNPPEASVSLRLPLASDGHTAIYDIAARTVYLPDGQRLEAHSGLGNHLDDPRFVKTRMRGPTPPNIYNLTLRDRLFHGVRAIRLVPVDDGKMFGRDGILAHTYMLGPSGQSNGCVSFRNYPAFLDAFLRGEVDRLVVVERLATTTGARTSAPSGG
jgi:hypothetical protein